MATEAPHTSSPATAGLSDADVAERVAQGLVNDLPDSSSRTVAEIVRANVVTRFNILLGILFVMVLFVAPINDALFGIVLVVNTAIGVIQEVRAKQTLDRLELLSAPRARVVRNGEARDIPVNQVVLDDVLEVGPGDQIVVDGTVATSRQMEVNEALLTGESEPVVKKKGDRCLSGSFVVAGMGRYTAEKVGRDAYAVQLAEEARRFTLVRSELRRAIDWILAAVSWLIVPAIGLLVWSQLEATESVRESLRGAVAGGVAMVPQGLVLLTSIAFAVGIVRLGRRNVLVRELPAVEGLARVNVVCFDKTGTLTEGTLSVADIRAVRPGFDPEPVLATLAWLDERPNSTAAALREHFPAQLQVAADGAVVPFSSSRKWSGADLGGRAWVLGAPDVVAPDDADLAAHVAEATESGHRVLLLAGSKQRLDGRSLPADLEPHALVVLGDRIRPDAASTLRYFSEQGLTAKVISGDHPSTVAAVAAEVGVPGAMAAIDARDLPDDPEALADAMEEYTVFGRVRPHQKRAMVTALQSRGHVVAMTGDGVNDVLALKDADMGIAVGSGSPASRAVAQLVLLDGRFASLPGVVGEGRRVIANIERVANLFVTKTVYAVLLITMTAVVGRAFPFLPRHLTLVGSLTIGIPAFLLALEPNRSRARPGFIPRVLRFAIPTGTAAAVATYAAYEVAIAESAPLVEARTMATVVLAAIGLFALVIVSRPLNPLHRLLIGAMGLLLVLVLLSDRGRDFFALNMPGITLTLAMVGILAITGSAMYGTLRAVGWMKVVPEILRTPPRPRPARTWGEFVRQWSSFREDLSPERIRRRLAAPAGGDDESDTP